MDLNSLLISQLVTDALLCIGILFLLFRLRRLSNPGSMDVGEKTMKEYFRLLEISRKEADQFLEELEKAKKELKDLAALLEEKEAKLKKLMKAAGPYPETLSSGQNDTDQPQEAASFSEEKYGQVLHLARKGLNEAEISQQSGLPEGEVALILSLSRAESK